MKLLLGSIKWLEKHPYIITSSLFLIVALIVQDLRASTLAKVVLRRCLSLLFYADWTNQAHLLRPWAFFLFAFCFYLMVLSAVFLIRDHLLFKHYKTKFETQGEGALKTVKGMIGAALRVNEELFPNGDGPPFAAQAVENQIFINKNFDGESRTEYRLSAANEPVSLMRYEIWVEEDADSVFLLDGTKFSVTNGEGFRYAYIPVSEAPRRKQMMIYFLPPIKPGNEVRKVVITHRWPRMFARLENLASEDWEWNLKLSEKIPEAKFEVYMEPRTGTKLEVTVLTPGLQNQTLDEELIPRGLSKWPGWVYTIKDAPAGVYKIGLRLKKS